MPASRRRTRSAAGCAAAHQGGHLVAALHGVRAGGRGAGNDDVADFRSAGALATAPGGHPTQLLAALPGADLPVLAPETAAALTAAAHEAGLRMIAHATTAAEAAIALDSGVDGLAHVWTDLAPDDPASQRLSERARDQGVFVVTTLAYFEAVTAQNVRTADCVRPGGSASASGSANSGGSASASGSANSGGALRVLRRAGVPLLAGTDATPFTPAHGAGMHRELRLLTEAGLSAQEALTAATSLPAHHFGLSDRGRIAPGLRADLVLVEGDPTRDVTALSSITGIWRRGVR